MSEEAPVGGNAAEAAALASGQRPDLAEPHDSADTQQQVRSRSRSVGRRRQLHELPWVAGLHENVLPPPGLELPDAAMLPTQSAGLPSSGPPTTVVPLPPPVSFDFDAEFKSYGANVRAEIRKLAHKLESRISALQKTKTRINKMTEEIASVMSDRPINRAHEFRIGYDSPVLDQRLVMDTSSFGIVIPDKDPLGNIMSFESTKRHAHRQHVLLQLEIDLTVARKIRLEHQQAVDLKSFIDNCVSVVDEQAHCVDTLDLDLDEDTMAMLGMDTSKIKHLAQRLFRDVVLRAAKKKQSDDKNSHASAQRELEVANKMITKDPLSRFTEAVDSRVWHALRSQKGKGKGKSKPSSQGNYDPAEVWVKDPSTVEDARSLIQKNGTSPAVRAGAKSAPSPSTTTTPTPGRSRGRGRGAQRGRGKAGRGTSKGRGRGSSSSSMANKGKGKGTKAAGGKGGKKAKDVVEAKASSPASRT
eukprot:TRINITY_DN32302_c0_g1_i1.p1 TRINITY_DN32302_c0_g1~~TRINITY_DN32302_c0_g1_i1.p1  ORF type:complete len:472 (+),score=62.84 TRINITY_DN32302_c0_g1_i1:239-1654(+)